MATTFARGGPQRATTMLVAARYRDLPPWLPGALLTVLVSIPAWAPMLSPDLSLWQLYDGGNHVRKAFHLAQLIADGNWYPRWISHQFGGYGYPTFNFYAPSTYYGLVALAILPRVGLYEAFQLLSVLASIALILGVYATAWALWRHAPAAFLAAGAVAYAPYIIPNNLFLSGWLPQVLGQACVVWLYAQIIRLWRAVTDRRGATAIWWVIAGVTGALLMTHNASAVMALPLLVALVASLWLWRPSVRTIILLAAAAGLAAALTAVLWLPAILETPLVQLERMYRGNLHYRNHFMTWPGFNPPLWGLQERSPYTVGMPIDLKLIYPNSAYGPTKLGLWQGLMLLASVLALVVAAAPRRLLPAPLRPTQDDRRLTLLIIAGSVAAFLLCYSQNFEWWLPAWERFPALRVVQLPERFLTGAIYAVALASAGAFTLYARRDSRAWAVALNLVAILAVAHTANRFIPRDPGVQREVSASIVIQNERREPGFTDSTDEFLPRTAGYETWHEGEARGFWLYQRVFPEAAWVGGRVRAWAGDLAVRGLRGGLLWTAADVDAGPNGATLALHQLAFPGWRAWIDDQSQPVKIVPRVEGQNFDPGFLIVDVPPGSHRVTIAFGPDGPRLAGIVASLVTAAGIGSWFLALGLRRRRAWLPLAAGSLVVLAATLAAGRTIVGLAPPRGDNAGQSMLVVNLVDAVRSGTAAISSPSGSAIGPDRFIDVRFLTVHAQDRPVRDVGPETRRWLYVHPPSEVSVDLTLPPDSYFQAGLALDPQTWTSPTGDGARFLVTVTPNGGASVAVLDMEVNPRARGEQRRWLDVAADLRPWAGQAVRLTLRTDSRQDPTFDWAGWSEPSIVRVDAITGARLLDSTVQLKAIAFHTS